jgi:hypothetical protein
MRKKLNAFVSGVVAGQKNIPKKNIYKTSPKVFTDRESESSISYFQIVCFFGQGRTFLRKKSFTTMKGG